VGRRALEVPELVAPLARRLRRRRRAGPAARACSTARGGPSARRPRTAVVKGGPPRLARVWTRLG
jgi:hypothetical protein